MPLPLLKTEPTPSSAIAMTLAVASGKGGVGKSTVAVNLALALKEKGLAVGLLDGDIYGPSLQQLLPAERPCRVDGEAILPAESLGMPVISLAYFNHERDPAALRAPLATGIITQFLESTRWGKLDLLIIDFPPGTGDIHLTLCQRAQLTAALLITTPQELALLDVRKTLALFQRLQVPLLGVVENMSYYQLGAERYYPLGRGGGQRLAAEAAIPFLQEIPLDPWVTGCADRGGSLFTGAEAAVSPAVGAFRTLADAVGSRLGTVALAPEVAPSGPHHFTLTWRQDGITEGHRYRYSDVQALCRCARCLEGTPHVDPTVSAHHIEAVGNYALRFAFTAGCSSGIYSYEMLYRHK